MMLVGWLVIFHFDLCLLFCTFGITLNFASQNQRLLIMIKLHEKVKYLSKSVQLFCSSDIPVKTYLYTETLNEF
jgi:hypothetical protein